MYELQKGDYLETLQTVPSKSIDRLITDFSDFSLDKFPFFSRWWDECQRVLRDDGVLIVASNSVLWDAIQPDALALTHYEIIHDLKIPDLPRSTHRARHLPIRVAHTLLIFAKATPTPRIPYPTDAFQYARSTPLNAPLRSFNEPSPSKLPPAFHLCSVLRVLTHQPQPPLSPPTVLWEWVIASYTESGMVIFDPQMKRGTIGEATLRQGQLFQGIEAREDWYQATLARLEAVQPSR